MMRARCVAVLVMALSALSMPARADAIGASVGWAFPAGSLEQGSKTADVTHGLGTLALDYRRALTPALSLVLFGRYGVAVPTLCVTASDCTSSLGRDVAVGLRVGYAFIELRDELPLIPRVELGVGWEWLTTKLHDGDSGASRSYAGPILASLELAGDARLSRRFTLSPTFSLMSGTFAHLSLGTPAGEASQWIGSRELHTWVSLSLRLSASF